MGPSSDRLQIRLENGFGTFAVRVIPNAPRDAVVGVRNGKLILKINATALEGVANERIVEFLAEILGKRKREIELYKGLKNREKVFKVKGLEADQIDRLLEREFS